MNPISQQEMDEIAAQCRKDLRIPRGVWIGYGIFSVAAMAMIVIQVFA
jgi:hypothetical protein